MTTQEQADLDTMKAKIITIKIQCFDYCAYLEREVTRNPEMLKNTGHKSVEAGMASAIRGGMREIANLTKSHLRKYPD